MPTAQDHWLVALPILLVAAAVTMASVPFSRWLSFKVGAVALPGGRNIHLHPTGRLGGLSLTAGFAVALAIFGRGVTFMEHTIDWHYWPLDEERYRQALADLDLLEQGRR